jgi:hypothetical protein
MCDPCREDGHAPKIKITYTHIYPTAPTLGVRKNMPFSPKNLSPTLGEDPKRLLGFQINAPRL